MTAQTASGRPVRLIPGSNPELIVEVSQIARPAWMTERQILDQVQLRRPEASRAAVNRAVWRLVKEGWLDVRAAHDGELHQNANGRFTPSLKVFRALHETWETPHG